MTDTDWSEHYIKRGDPSKPTYYIIRREYPGTGLIYLAPEKLGLLKVKPALM